MEQGNWSFCLLLAFCQLKTDPATQQHRSLQVQRGDGLRQCYSHSYLEIHLKLKVLLSTKQAKMTHGESQPESCCQIIPVKLMEMLLVTADTVHWYWGCSWQTAQPYLGCGYWYDQQYYDFTAGKYPGDPQTCSLGDSQPLPSTFHTHVGIFLLAVQLSKLSFFQLFH